MQRCEADHLTQGQPRSCRWSLSRTRGRLSKSRNHHGASHGLGLVAPWTLGQVPPGSTEMLKSTGRGSTANSALTLQKTPTRSSPDITSSGKPPGVAYHPPHHPQQGLHTLLCFHHLRPTCSLARGTPQACLACGGRAIASSALCAPSLAGGLESTDLLPDLILLSD